MHRLLCAAIVLLLLPACATPSAAAPKIQVQNAWARPTMAGSMGGMTATPAMPGMAGTEASSAAYFVIVNDGSGADALIGVAADMASAAMHETHLVGDVAQMAPVARVVVPAHARVEFKPGGYHVMLTGLKHDLVVGDTLKLTLQFEKSGAVTVEVPVRQEPSK